MEKSIKLKLKFRKYEFYPDKILFKTKVYCGRIKVPPTLENFAYLDKAYVKINNKIKTVNLHQYYEKKTRQLNGYVSIKLNKKVVEVFVKTKPKFATILNTALASKRKLRDEFTKGTKLYVNKAGKLLMKLLVASASGSKSHSNVHNLLSGKIKSILLETLLNFCKESKLNESLLTPFVENYYVAIAKQELKFPKEHLFFNKRIYRAIGLINGDGHLSRFGVSFGNKNKKLHNDFKLGINLVDHTIEFKENEDCNGFLRTYVYSSKLAKKLQKLGAIIGNKLLAVEEPKIPKNFYAITEYLGGLFDTEGSFAKGHHLIISNCSSIRHNTKSNNNITNEEYRFLLNLANSKGTLYTLPRGYKYYKLSLRSIKSSADKIKEEVLKKVNSSSSTLLTNVMNILNELGINAKKEPKYLLIYPDLGNVSIVWWIEITHIEDVIKFTSIVKIHDKGKRKMIRSFVRNYVTDNELAKIITHVNDSLKR